MSGPASGPGSEGLSFGRALPTLACLTGAFFLLFMARNVIGPLMVPVRADLGLSNSQAGMVISTMGLGVMLGLVSSGFLAKAFSHRMAAAGALLLCGSGALGASLSSDYAGLLAGMWFLGLGAGLYLPSGVAVITGLTRERDWGKALSVHELAPNFSFVLAPLWAELCLSHGDWRLALRLLAWALLGAGALLAAFGPGRGQKGQAPGPRLLRSIMSKPLFWVMAVLFGLAVGATVGPFTMLPLYLTEEHGYARETANQLLAVSRVSGLVMVFAGGWLVDRLGAVQTIRLYLLLCGGLTACLGLLEGPALAGAVIAQPLVSACFFPAGFAAISRAFSWEERNVAVSLVTPAGALVGASMVPAALGGLGDTVGFGIGFAGLGGVMLAALALLRLLPRGQDRAETGGVS
ncbi:MFS transporter [Desulfohalovibrio reitneri]|uniref:MFS transporter n=1 Tax=Desulfohalovibrio reitneri TaxID=1307759 RepID=UPI00054EB566|nr:MFS transporter [Desulfohalovibrio reitneri]